MIFLELHQACTRVLFNIDNILYIEDKGESAFICCGYKNGDPMYEEVDETYDQVLQKMSKAPKR